MYAFHILQKQLMKLTKMATPENILELVTLSIYLCIPVRAHTSVVRNRFD